MCRGGKYNVSLRVAWHQQQKLNNYNPCLHICTSSVLAQVTFFKKKKRTVAFFPPQHSFWFHALVQRAMSAPCPRWAPCQQQFHAESWGLAHNFHLSISQPPKTASIPEGSPLIISASRGKIHVKSEQLPSAGQLWAETESEYPIQNTEGYFFNTPTNRTGLGFGFNIFLDKKAKKESFLKFNI